MAQYLLGVLALTLATQYHIAVGYGGYQDFGDPCSDSEDCSYLYADCISGVCGCYSPEMEYFPNSLACGIPVGHSCEMNPYYCVDGATCGEDSNTCLCTSGQPLADGSFTRKRSSYCLMDADCNNGLNCHNGRCECPGVQTTMGKLEIMNEYSEFDECRVVPGGICSSSTECVPNASCVSGRCSCNTGYSSNAGICGLSFGQPCKSYNWYYNIKKQQDLCSETRGLVCLEGKCACPDTPSTFNSTLNACVASVGKTCGYVANYEPAPRIICKGNAECVGEAGDTLYRSRRDFDATCQCKLGFKLVGDECVGSTTTSSKPKP